MMVQTHIYMYIPAMVLTPQLILLLYHYSDLIWSVHEDLCGSDHFPISVNTNDRLGNDPLKNWNFRKVDWIKFENLCSETILVENFENQADPIQKLTETQVLLINVYLRHRLSPKE